jgi:phage terminase large subunit
MFFDDLEKIIEDIESIQADEKNPNDCAKDPHDVTHTVDAVRYFAINRARKAKKAEKKRKIDPLAFLTDSEDEDGDNYESFLCGGEITDDYMG